MIYYKSVQGDSRYSSQVAASDKKCNTFSYIFVELEVIDCVVALLRKLTSYFCRLFTHTYLIYMKMNL